MSDKFLTIFANIATKDSVSELVDSFYRLNSKPAFVRLRRCLCIFCGQVGSLVVFNKL